MSSEESIPSTTVVPITLGPELSKALVAAYGEMKNPAKDAENPYYQSTYATLAACRNATAPFLAKHGICMMQSLRTVTLPGPEGAVLLATECRTILLHESGQGVEFDPFTLPANQPTAQSLGSAATFARRYTHNAITNISADDDDDANEASHSGRTVNDRPAHDRPPAPANTQRIPPKPIPVFSNGEPQVLRPDGLFGYGKKFVDTPWNLMGLSQLEWFRDADRTPAQIRDKCRAEIAWRAYESARAEEQRPPIDKEFDDHIPM